MTITYDRFIAQDAHHYLLAQLSQGGNFDGVSAKKHFGARTTWVAQARVKMATMGVDTTGTARELLARVVAVSAAHGYDSLTSGRTVSK